MDKIIKTNNNFDERIPWIDFARGLTMFFVIWSHTLLYRNIPGKYLTAGYIGVFFFITGYLMQNRKISKKTGIIIIKKQVKKLLIPYTLASIILILISGFWSYIANGYIIKQDIINFFGMFYGRLFLSIRQDMPQIVFLGASNAALWFLPAMFLSSLLYLVLRITKFPYIIFLISIFICCGIVFTFSPVLLPWSLDTAPIFAVVMFSAKLYQNYEKLSSKLRKIFLIPITLIYIACVDFGGGVNLSLSIYGSKGIVSVILYMLIAILESILILEVSKLISNIKVVKVFFEGMVWLGQNSLYFLCFQGLLINTSRLISSKVFPALSGWAEMFITLFGGSLVVYIYHTIKKKNERKC